MKVVDTQSGRYFGLPCRTACARRDGIPFQISGRPNGTPFQPGGRPSCTPFQPSSESNNTTVELSGGQGHELAH